MQQNCFQDDGIQNFALLVPKLDSASQYKLVIQKAVVVCWCVKCFQHAQVKCIECLVNFPQMMVARMAAQDTKHKHKHNHDNDNNNNNDECNYIN